MSPAVRRRLAEEVMTPEKDPWNRPRRNLKLVAERRGSGLRLWAILVAGVVGLVVLLVWAFPQRALGQADWVRLRSEEHTSELQSLMRISYAVFCLKKKNPKR